MTENKKKPPSCFRHAARAALVLTSQALAAQALASLLGASPLWAAEIQFRPDAPSAVAALGLPLALLGGETRVPAARPPASGPAYANDGVILDDLFAGPQGRLRLRPAHFGGM